jgi:zinc D-Ala-D-Ala dipeptidase
MLGFVSGVFFAQLPVCGVPADEPLVDVSKIDPAIVIDLRYATARNIFGHPVYPPGAPCLVRSGVAERLVVAQQFLRPWGVRLKIWDAYRPPYAQKMLWSLVHNPKFAAEPDTSNALHTRGAAVDVTLVDSQGHDLPMPSDFDDFTASAKSAYKGPDPVVERDIRLLQNAMYRGGFYESNSEWWHFMPRNWKQYGPPPIVPAFATPGE